MSCKLGASKKSSQMFFIFGKNCYFCSLFLKILHSLKRTNPATTAASDEETIYTSKSGKADVSSGYYIFWVFRNWIFAMVRQRLGLVNAKLRGCSIKQASSLFNAILAWELPKFPQIRSCDFSLLSQVCTTSWMSEVVGACCDTDCSHCQRGGNEERRD